MNRGSEMKQRPPLPSPLLAWRRGGPKQFMVAVHVRSRRRLPMTRVARTKQRPHLTLLRPGTGARRLRDRRCRRPGSYPDWAKSALRIPFTLREDFFWFYASDREFGEIFRVRC